MDSAVFSSLSEQDLLIRLGKELTADEQRALPLSTQELIERANNWLDVKTTQMRGVVCSNVNVKKYVSDSDYEKLLTTIADLIASVCGGVPAINVSALLIKRGLKKLCAQEWKVPT